MLLPEILKIPECFLYSSKSRILDYSSRLSYRHLVSFARPHAIYTPGCHTRNCNELPPMRYLATQKRTSVRRSQFRPEANRHSQIRPEASRSHQISPSSTMPIAIPRIQLELGLAKELVEHIRYDRSDANEEDSDDEPDTREEMDGVRLGPDFLSSPKTFNDVLKCTQNYKKFSDCVNQIDLVILLGVLDLTKHFLRQFLEKEESGGEDSDSYDAVPILDRIVHGFCDSTTSRFVSFYSIGKNDGFEDGISHLMAILGENPKEAAWYPFTRASNQAFPTSPQLLAGSTSGRRYLPLGVKSRREVDGEFSRLLERTRTCVLGLELAITNMVRFAQRQFITRRATTPGDVFRNNNATNELRSQTIRCAEHLYEVGLRVGFQLGQVSVKKRYGSEYKDYKIYCLGAHGEHLIVVDSKSPSDCSCDSCPRCIDKKNAATWERQLRNVKHDLVGFAREISKK